MFLGDVREMNWNNWMMILKLKNPRIWMKIDIDPTTQNEGYGYQTYQWTSTPPPLSTPSWMNSLLIGICCMMFSSSRSSISTIRCFRPWNEFGPRSPPPSWTKGDRKAESTWVMLASLRISFWRGENSLDGGALVCRHVDKSEKWQ